MGTRPTQEDEVKGEYGIVANVTETDKVLRKGAKVWIVGGWSGGGFERVTVRGAARNGRQIEKYAPITRFTNFRAAWMPDHLREQASILGEKVDMESRAQKLSDVAEALRVSHPGRREMMRNK